MHPAVYEESAWLKDNATENLNGFWKPVMDTAINVGQGVALSPLMLLGPEAYLAGTATNAAAEEMFEKTESGKTASDAFGSGLLTVGVEVAGGKIMDIKNPFKPASVKQVVKEIRNGNFEIINALREALQFEGVREGTNYLINYLADQMLRNPDAEFNINDFLKSSTKNETSKFVDKRSKNLWNAIESAWNAIE